MTKLIQELEKNLTHRFADLGAELRLAHGEVTMVVEAEHQYTVLNALRDEKAFRCDVLIDVCGVDYSVFGEAEWTTEQATFKGFSRGRDVLANDEPVKLAVVYHLLSTVLNHRIRVKVFCDESLPVVRSVVSLWPSADWFEREAYDLYGILFEGHEDLRRILTDYGFVGHPFRKSFPTSGHVEMRYDAKTGRVIYEPVEIEPRVLVPKVIRRDNRFVDEEAN